MVTNDTQKYISLQEKVEESYKKRLKNVGKKVGSSAKNAGSSMGKFAKRLWSDDSHLD